MPIFGGYKPTADGLTQIRALAEDRIDVEAAQTLTFTFEVLSETAIAAVVAIAISMVKLMSSGRSRAKAACHAKCPNPALSQIASIGISAPIPMLAEAAKSASI